MEEKMKPSGIDDINIPADWECSRFRKLFSFSKGLNITKESLVDEGVPVVSYGQVHSKTNTGTAINDTMIRFVPESYLKSDRQALTRVGDFIFADTSEDLDGVGNCAFVDRESNLFAGYHSIIARLKTVDIYPKYFAYQFLTDMWRSQMRANVMGVKVFSITQKLIRDTAVIIPGVCEQQAIADYLDVQCAKIDSITADLEKQIELLQKYKKSLITETVTKGLNKSAPMKDSGIAWIGEIPLDWKVSRIKYLIDPNHPYPIGDGDHGMIKADDYLDEGIPYIRVLNLTWGYGLNMDSIVYISKEMNELIKNSELKPNDLLIAKTGATIGKTAIVPNTLPISNTTSHVGKITLPITHHAKYFYYVLTSDIIQKQIQDISAMQSTRPELGIDGLKNMVVIVPTISEQRAISQYLDKHCDAVDEIIKDKNEQLSVISVQKKSLIYEYVTGKKRVKEAEQWQSKAAN